MVERLRETAILFWCLCDMNFLFLQGHVDLFVFLVEINAMFFARSNFILYAAFIDMLQLVYVAYPSAILLPI